MPTVALFILLAGALAGALLATRHFMRKAMPMPIALAHGFAGAAALLVLLLEVLSRPTFSTTGWALVILVGAALLGFVNFSFHLRARRHRSALVVLHALVAVCGVGTLLWAIAGA
jgi:hypothetical protein